MANKMARRLDSKLECPKCKTIYLTFTQDLTPNTAIACSSCGQHLGTWGQLEAEFYAEGGGDGIFRMQDGQIIRKD
jgi:predicted RNA-binding Zn-ribbon protein involved in translation (DUF1610 family)